MNAYLLAGGRSRRMGRSKIDLPFGESTFVQIVSAAARPVFEEVVAVQRPGGEPVDRVETIFEAPHDEAAPVFGVARALEHAGGRCFILAIDYPLITSDVLRFLRDRFLDSASPMLVPVWKGRAQMLCAGYSTDLLPRIRERIDARRFDLRGIVDDAPAEIVAEEELRDRFEGEPLMNVNTPSELEQAESFYARS